MNTYEEAFAKVFIRWRNKITPDKKQKCVLDESRSARKIRTNWQYHKGCDTCGHGEGSSVTFWFELYCTTHQTYEHFNHELASSEFVNWVRELVEVDIADG